MNHHITYSNSMLYIIIHVINTIIQCDIQLVIVYGLGRIHCAVFSVELRLMV